MSCRKYLFKLRRVGHFKLECRICHFILKEMIAPVICFSKHNIKVEKKSFKMCIFIFVKAVLKSYYSE